MENTILNSDFSSFIDSFPPSASSLTVLHVNIRSIRKYWDEFQLIVGATDAVVDVFILTEINVLDVGVSQGQFSLPGFEAFFLTRNSSRGGGIAVYIKKTWSAISLDISLKHAECLSLKLCKNNFVISLLAVYRPPSQNVRNFLDELTASLETMVPTDKLCIVGDMNIDLLKPFKSAVCDYLNILATYGIDSVIQTPTREEYLSDQVVISCIDHINIRNSGVPILSAVIKQKLADHYFVACRICAEVISEELDQQKQIAIMNSSNFDRLISSYNWSHIIENCNYHDAYLKLVEIFSSFRTLSTKTITVRKRRPNQPWLTSEVLSAIKEKDILWARCRRSPQNKELKLQFQTKRNRVNALIRSKKRQHFQEKFFRSRFDVSKTWAIVNEVKGCSTRSSIDDTIKKHFGTNMSSVAERFNCFFASVSGVLHDKDVVPSNLQRSCLSSAFLPNITAEDLHTLLFSFKPSKAPGADNIRLVDLRRNLDALSNVLLHILNGIINCGVIPVGLKSAIVRPLFKGGKRDSVESYRPISILPCLALVLEKHILKTMTMFLEKFEILSPSQHGFIAGRGTDSLLEEFVDTLHATFDNNKYACTLFLDVSKAFDSISHKILEKKIYDYGFRGPFFRILQDFLANRTQHVSLCNTSSVSIHLKAGVPQGSVLSPLLFNLYVNDLSKTVSGCDLYQYADDTLLVSRHINLCSAISLLQTNATRVIDWFDANCIKINIDKTKLMCFSSPLKRKCPEIPFVLHSSKCTHCICAPLDFVPSIKYLGIFFDCDLSWNSHLSYVAKRLRSVSCMLYSTKTFFPFSVRNMLANALAYGLLRYGITIYANCSMLWQNKIDTILKSILRSVAYTSTSVPSDELFETLCLPRFLALFRRCVISKHYWQSSFKTPRVVKRDLREGERFIIPRVYTKYGKRLRSFYVPELFNGLPDTFLDITTKRRLKKSLRAVC